jgi:membrane-bound serine protease (ClpP class)
VSALTTNPDVALLLIVLGALGIYAEFLRPGAVAPGVCGCVLLLFGAAGFPSADWRGVALLLVGFLLCLVEALYPARNLLAATGMILMPLSALLEDRRIHPVTALATMVPFAGVTSFLLKVAVRARRNKLT